MFTFSLSGNVLRVILGFVMCIVLLLPNASLVSATSQYSDQVNSYLKQSFERFNAQDYDGSISLLSKAIELDDKCVMAYRNRGFIYLFHKTEAMSALNDFNKVLELDPADAGAYLYRGTVYVGMMKTDKAVADFTEAIKYDPQNVDAYYMRATYSSADQGLNDYNQILAINPKFAPAYFGRANIHNILGRPELAVADYNSGLAIDSHNRMAYIDRGQILKKLGYLDLAIASFTKALANPPDASIGKNNIWYNDNKLYMIRGKCYQDQGSIYLALDDYNRVKAYNPLDREDITLYYNRGLIYKQIGNRQMAIGNFKEYIKCLKFIIDSSSGWYGSFDTDKLRKQVVETEQMIRNLGG